MILKYTKIAPQALSRNYVSIDSFRRQIEEIRHKKIVSLDDYNPNNPDHIVLTFDDGNKNVLEYAVPIMKKLSYPFEIFIVSNYIGKLSFDTREPIVDMCSVNDLKEIVKNGGRLQWHTKNHPNFSKMKNLTKIEKELIVPEELSKIDKKGFRWFAYTYGIFNKDHVRLVKKRFKGAVSCTDGDNSQYELKRLVMRDETTFNNSGFKLNERIGELEVQIEQLQNALSSRNGKLGKLRSKAKKVSSIIFGKFS